MSSVNNYFKSANPVNPSENPSVDIEKKVSLFQVVAATFKENQNAPEELCKERITRIHRKQLQGLKKDIQSLEKELSATIYSSENTQNKKNKIKIIQSKLRELYKQEKEFVAYYTDALSFIPLFANKENSVAYLFTSNEKFYKELSTVFNAECFNKLLRMHDNKIDDLFIRASIDPERLQIYFNAEFIDKLDQLPFSNSDKLHVLKYGVPYAIIHSEDYLRALNVTEAKPFLFTIKAAEIWSYSPDLFHTLSGVYNYIQMSKVFGCTGFDLNVFISYSKKDQKAFVDYFLVASEEQLKFIPIWFQRKGKEHPVFKWIAAYGSKAVHLVKTLQVMELTRASPKILNWMLNPKRTFEQLELMQKCYNYTYNPKYAEMVKVLTSDIISERSTPLLKLFEAGQIELCLKLFQNDPYFQGVSKQSISAPELESIYVQRAKNSDVSTPPDLDKLKSVLDDVIKTARKWKEGPQEDLIAMEVAHICTHVVITKDGFVDNEKLIELIAILKEYVQESGLKFYALQYLIDHLERVSESPEIRDLFFGYARPGYEISKQVFSALLIPIRQENVGNCFMIAPLIAISTNSALSYVKHLFDAAQNVSLVRTVNLTELKKYKLNIDKEGKLKNSTLFIWHVPSIRAIYESLRISEDAIPSITQNVLKDIKLEDLTLDQLTVKLASHVMKVDEVVLISSMKSLFVDDDKNRESIQLFKKSLNAFYDCIEHPLNSRVAAMISSSNYSALKVKRNSFVKHLRSVVNKGNPKDKDPKSLAERYFIRHPKLSKIEESTKSCFDKALKYYAKRNLFWYWNNGLPQLSESNDKGIPENKKMPGGYSLYHIKFGAIDSQEAFQANADSIFDDFNKEFLKDLDAETRDLLLNNDWNNFIKLLGKFFERDHNASSLQSFHHQQKEDSRIEQHLPWRMPAGDRLGNAVLYSFNLSSVVYHAKTIETVQELRKTYVDALKNLPMSIKEKIKSSKNALRIPVGRPFHGLNVFLYDEVPALPKMPRLVLTIEEQDRILSLINFRQNTSVTWSGERKDLTIREVSLKLKSLLADTYYLKDNKFPINYFEDDTEIGVNVDQMLLIFCYDLKDEWKSELKNDLENSELKKKYPQFKEDIQGLLYSNYRSLRELLFSEEVAKILNYLSKEEHEQFNLQLNSLSCFPKSWYDKHSPAYDLNWRNNIYGYWFQNPIKEELDYIEISYDGTKLAELTPEEFNGSWKVPKLGVVNHMLSIEAIETDNNFIYYLIHSFKYSWSRLSHVSNYENLKIISSSVEKLETCLRKPYRTRDENIQADILRDLVASFREIGSQKIGAAQYTTEDWKEIIQIKHIVVELILFYGTMCCIYDEINSKDQLNKIQKLNDEQLLEADKMIKEYCECLENNCEDSFENHEVLASLAKLAETIQERYDLFSKLYEDVV